MSIFLLLAALHSHAAAPPATLSDLDTAALAFRLVFDGRTGRACGIDAARAATLLNELHARIDEEKTRLLKTPYSAQWPTLSRLETCEKGCHCGVYSDLVESAPPPARKKAWSKALESARAKASAQTSAEGKACVRNAAWLCRSLLLKSLKARE